MERVHPRVRPEDYVEEKERVVRRPPSTLERRLHRRRLILSTLVIGIIAASIVVYGFALHSPDTAQPRIQVSPGSFDFGDIPPEVAVTTFTVKNVGEGELVLLSIATSCMCTSAVFRFRGRESPIFGAHGNPEGWSERLMPGESGQLEVRYDPNVHPDSGQVMRVVYVRSNDPVTPEVQLTITANVVRG
jgi:hypothetical protein